MDNFWIGSTTDIRTGQAAFNALATQNDKQYWTDSGSIKVDEQRWQQAQQFEADCWLKTHIGASQDRDDEHKTKFGLYKSLPTNLGNTIEVGCGPFTQLRTIIKEGHVPESVTLLDPLLDRYFDQPHCSYKSKKLSGFDVSCINGRLEDIDFVEMFDTAIMINVIEHCLDAIKALSNYTKLLKVGGIAIFHERYWDRFDPNKMYDIGHPIRVKKFILDEFKKQFEMIFENSEPSVAADGLYMIGKKIGTPRSI